MASSSRAASPPLTVAQAAADLLRSGTCIWCERRPMAAGSLLCGRCVACDSTGMLTTGTVQSVADRQG